MNSDPSLTLDQRRAPRDDLAAAVTLEFAPGALVGPGKNISQSGVYFTIDAGIAVSLRIAGRDGAVAGELVRVDNMGGGQFGIAVRFVEKP